MVAPFAQAEVNEEDLLAQFEELLDQLGTTSREAVSVEMKRLEDLVRAYDADQHSPFAGGDAEWEPMPVRLVFSALATTRQ